MSMTASWALPGPGPPSTPGRGKRDSKEDKLIFRILERSKRANSSAGRLAVARSASAASLQSAGSVNTAGTAASSRLNAAEAASAADFGVPCYPAGSIARRAQVARLLSWRKGPARGLLRVRVAHATGLRVADLSGYSDPYVVVRCGAQTRRTRIIKKTLQPIWEETFDFKGCLDELIVGIRLVVLDHDDVGMDDVLGECRAKLPVELRMQTEPCTYECYERLNTEGMLSFSLTWIPEPSSVSWAPSPTPPATPAKGAHARSAPRLGHTEKPPAHDQAQTASWRPGRSSTNGRTSGGSGGGASLAASPIRVPVLLPSKFTWCQEMWEFLPKQEVPARSFFEPEAFATRRDEYMKRVM
jgi:hypothetical protein